MNKRTSKGPVGPPGAADAGRKPRARDIALSRESSLLSGSAEPATRGTLSKLPPHVARSRDTVLAAIEDLKGKDVVVIDIRDKASFADLLVIASGTSSRHVRSLADEVVKQSKARGSAPIGVEGEREGEWALVDLADIVVHLMLPRVREFYGLERLWQVGDVDDVGAQAFAAADR